MPPHLCGWPNFHLSSKDLGTSHLPASALQVDEFLPGQLEPKQSPELAGVKGGMLARTGEAKPSPCPAPTQISPLQPLALWPQLQFCTHHGKPERSWGSGGCGGTTCCFLGPGHVYGERGEHRVAFNCGTAGWKVFSVDTCGLHIGSCTSGDLLSDKAEPSTATPSELAPSTLPTPAKGG